MAVCIFVVVVFVVDGVQSVVLLVCVAHFVLNQLTSLVNMC